MKPLFTLTALALGLATTSVAADETCAWAGGAYSFSDHGIYGDFTVNADCTEMVWSRLSDGSETSALTRSKQGWKGELDKADFELLENGHSLRLTGNGGVMRASKAKRTN